MKHLLITAIMVLGAVNLQAQDTVSVVVLQQKQIEHIQLNLQQAQKRNTLSVITGLAGVGIMVLGASNAENSKGYYIAGGALTLTSFFINLSAWSSIGKAGRYYPPYQRYSPETEEDEWRPRKGDLSDTIKRKE